MMLLQCLALWRAVTTGAIPENIHLPLVDDTELVLKNFRISRMDNSNFCRIPNPADLKSWGIPEFCKSLNGFCGIPVKILKILGGTMDFQSGWPSIYCRISDVVHGGVWIFSGIAQGTSRHCLLVCNERLKVKVARYIRKCIVHAFVS